MINVGLLGKIMYQKRMFMLWWFIGLAVMTLLMMLFFPSFRDSNLTDSFNSLPAALQKVVGDAASLNTIGGYIAQEVFLLRVPLLLIIMTVAFYAGLTAGEEGKGVLETHISLPISRSEIVATKLLSGVMILLVASSGALAGTLLGLLMIHESYGIFDLLPQLVGALLVSINFGLLAFLIGSATGRKGAAIGVSSAFAFACYLISALVLMVPMLETVEKASLFHYYQDPATLSLGNYLVLVSVALTQCVVAFLLFVRRDLKTD